MIGRSCVMKQFDFFIYRLSICILFVCGTEISYGQNEREYDLTIKTGAHVGGITKPASKKGEKARAFSFGGAPVAFVFNKDFSLNLSILLEGGFITDIKSRQVTKQGFYSGMAYHLLGGARRVVNTTQFATLVRSNPYNVSFIFMGGMQRFSASQKDNTDVHVTGAVVEVVGGLQLRMDVGDETSLGTEFLSTLISVPASVERLSVTGSSLLFFWRLFI